MTIESKMNMRIQPPIKCNVGGICVIVQQNTTSKVKIMQDLLVAVCRRSIQGRPLLTSLDQRQKNLFSDLLFLCKCSQSRASPCRMFASLLCVCVARPTLSQTYTQPGSSFYTLYKSRRHRWRQRPMPRFYSQDLMQKHSDRKILRK